MRARAAIDLPWFRRSSAISELWRLWISNGPAAGVRIKLLYCEVSRSDEKLVEMTNGCICCTLRDDLLEEVKRLADEKRFDYLLIESTGLCSEERAQSHPLWLKELYAYEDRTPETEEYGVRSFVYRARRPFHPVKLHALLNEGFNGVFRAKGHFWIATRPDLLGELSIAGTVTRTEGLGRWWAAVPKERWPRDPESIAFVRKFWNSTWGDRRQERVFIGGADMDKQAIRSALDACLHGSAITGVSKAHRKLEDPFPAWG